VSQLRFDGRVIAVTGAAQGMGREHALFLAGRGARVVVNDLKGAPETIGFIRQSGGQAIENTSDITDPAQTDRLVKEALEKWGRLDGIINNAAFNAGTLPDPETTAKVIGVHLIGTINMTRSAMPVFREQKHGRILNVGSGSMFGLSHCGTYAAGKGGVFAFTRTLAREFAAEPTLDLKANLILPVALTSVMPRVPDQDFQALLDRAFAPANIALLAALLVHEACPSQGEALTVGGGRVSRVLLATTEGWQSEEDNPSPEDILTHWDDVMANKNPQEPVGSMSDLLARRGLHPYSTADLIVWARTGTDPAQN
jgi:NAD(P)-dependent dehydrogenase (short-subunit alcohol dehydrogenase family)